MKMFKFKERKLNEYSVRYLHLVFISNQTRGVRIESEKPRFVMIKFIKHTQKKKCKHSTTAIRLLEWNNIIKNANEEEVEQARRKRKIEMRAGYIYTQNVTIALC
jgi:hypothetical protein